MLDNRVQVDTICLDFAKAFGRVDHHLLLKKLHLFGINGSLFCWFSDYLSNRFQQVTVLGKTSNLLHVISGVPQGSILGALMFLIYVNDLVTVSVNSSIALFADDTKCYRPVMNIDDGRLFQEDLDRITLWCQDWRMDLNAFKANRVLGFIRRSTLEVKIQSTRKALYKALVMSNLSYSSQVWAPQSVKLIEIIERVQRHATKYILSLPYRTDISYKERLRLRNSYLFAIGTNT
ncbi:putative RNA-directed DNA polymerase from transposon X-element [Acropora cervicornis]|uniref:RNA-directed DNA polymerase from transposon X-element n=1 Tax=Acropora cervicornis TaxID=6130 RepID=A0AAD9QBU0_ACRCE|nr:putative RNA-directed DNA polymerase from transposon X-element [Acropora cervicornis]